MKGLYLIKTYWIKNNNIIVPIVKFGYTNNLEIRLKHYGSTYSLIKFYECDYPKQRETYLKKFYFVDDFRISRNEHFVYQKGIIKELDSYINETIDMDIIKNNKGGYSYTDKVNA